MRVVIKRSLVSAFLLGAAFCLWKAWPGLIGESGPLASRVAHASTGDLGELRAGKPARGARLRTTPIQDLRVGMRVLGRNPVRADADRDVPQPEPATWRLVRLRMEHEPGKSVDAELLRPLEWLEEVGAKVGATIGLELPEMFVEGEAEVLAVQPCPPLEIGSDPLITGTFRHVADRVIELHAAGLAKPLVCTPQHPFWSVRRADFAPADHLEVGESVLTISGNSARITAIGQRAGPETVYGLEIYGEHVYHVGDAGLLVHNASSLSRGQLNNVEGEVFENTSRSRLSRNRGNPFFDSGRRGGFDDVTLEHGRVVIIEEKFARKLQYDDFESVTTNLRSNMQEVLDSLPGNTQLSRSEKALIHQTLSGYLENGVSDNLSLRVITGRASVGSAIQSKIASSTGLAVEVVDFRDL